MATVTKRKWSYNGQSREAWQVQYIDRAGRQQRKGGFKLKKDAERYKLKVETELEAGRHIAPRDSVVMSEMLDQFIKYLETQHDKGMIGRGYIDRVRVDVRAARAFMGAKLVSDITWQDVEAYEAELRTHRAYGGTKPLAQTTITNRLDVLGTVFGWGVRRGYAARNVVPDAKAEIGSRPRQHIKRFDTSTIKQLIASMEKRRFREMTRTWLQNRAIVFIALACGLRKGEILALSWDDIDLERGSIRVRHNLTPYDILKAPKTPSGVRSVPLPERVADAIRDYRPHVVTDSRGLIFRTFNGRNNYSSLSHQWIDILKNAELKGLRFHALRHYAGSSWLVSGMSLPEASRLLGHANPAITAQIYAHALETEEMQTTKMDAAMRLIEPAHALPIAQELHK